MTWLEVSLKRIDAKIHGITTSSFVRIRSGGSQANLQRHMMTVNTKTGYYSINITDLQDILHIVQDKLQDISTKRHQQTLWEIAFDCW